jgi:hypothetical protein
LLTGPFYSGSSNSSSSVIMPLTSSKVVSNGSMMLLSSRLYWISVGFCYCSSPLSFLTSVVLANMLFFLRPFKQPIKIQIAPRKTTAMKPKRAVRLDFGGYSSSEGILSGRCSSVPSSSSTLMSGSSGLESSSSGLVSLSSGSVS